MAPSIPDRLAGVAAQWRAPLPLDQSLPLVLPEGTALNSHVGSLDRKSWKVLGVIAGFARWSGASLAFITVGEGNSYGHPAASTIANWQAAGAKVARTDQQGSLAIWRQPDGSIGLVGQQG